MAIVTRFDLQKNRRTKIVATVGPASGSVEMCRKLVNAGVNVFRLNMSHGDHDGHAAIYRIIRQVAEELHLPVAIMADLCGPKIRTGEFEHGSVMLEEDTQVTITTRHVKGTATLIPSQYDGLPRDVSPGDRVLLADGLLELKVDSVSNDEVVCDVVHGGELGDHKGINLPGVTVSAPSLTDKDIDDARFAMALGVDFLAMSFVRQASDLEGLRELVDANDSNAQIIAKIEKPEALQNAEAILDVTDAIMVARGDLGVELPPEEVPVAQDALIQLAREKGRPVIVATQMLESMISHSRPTRAEVTDVSHAVLSGADAVMLSAETAVGHYPVEAVSIMSRVAKQTEAHLLSKGQYGNADYELQPPLPLRKVIANATSHMSRDLMVRAVMVISRTGASATAVSAARPAAPVVALTSNLVVYRRMALLWGMVPILVDEAGQANPNALARRAAGELGLATPGQYVLLVRGFSEDPVLNSPSVTVITV